MALLEVVRSRDVHADAAETIGGPRPEGVRLALEATSVRLQPKRGGAEDWLIAIVPLNAAWSEGRYCVDVTVKDWPGSRDTDAVTGRACGIDVGPPRDIEEERCDLLRRVGSSRSAGKTQDALRLVDDLLCRIETDPGASRMEREVALVEKAQLHRDLGETLAARECYALAADLSRQRRGGSPDPFFEPWLDFDLKEPRSGSVLPASPCAVE